MTTTGQRHMTNPRSQSRVSCWQPFAALLLGLVLAGCSTQHAASNQGSNGTGQNSTTTTHGSQAVKFSQCMRDNGVGNFPDPDASGQLTIDEIANNSSIDTSSAAFQQALAACRDLQPAGFTGTERSSQQQAAALAFAQCVRDNGVSDFPDPAAGDPLIDTTKIPSTNQPGGMDKLNAALSTCSKQAQAAGVTP
jgi:hypothetical protein